MIYLDSELAKHTGFMHCGEIVNVPVTLTGDHNTSTHITFGRVRDLLHAPNVMAHIMSTANIASGKYIDYANKYLLSFQMSNGKCFWVDGVCSPSGYVCDHGFLSFLFYDREAKCYPYFQDCVENLGSLEKAWRKKNN